MPSAIIRCRAPSLCVVAVIWTDCGRSSNPGLRLGSKNSSSGKHWRRSPSAPGSPATLNQTTTAHSSRPPFELFLSGSFRQRGWRLERHPKVPGSTRVPDYLAHTSRGDLFVEAVLARESDTKLAQDRVLRALSDALEPVEGPFHVIVTPLGPWDGRFSRKKVRQFLQDQVRELEQHPDEPERPVTYSQDEHLPLRFDILRTDTVGPVVGAWMVTGDTAVMVTTHLTLAEAIDKKVTRYGQLGLPYVVAVQAFTDFPAESRSIRQALFGTEAVTFRYRPGEFEYLGTTTHRNGIFSSLGAQGKPIRTRLSAVAFYRHWSDGVENHRHELAIFHNPFAAQPLDPTTFEGVPQLLANFSEDHEQVTFGWSSKPPDWADRDT
jgi:hypothetical protein